LDNDFSLCFFLSVLPASFIIPFVVENIQIGLCFPANVY